MAAVILASAALTCLGDQAGTLAALRRGRSGAARLHGLDGAALPVDHGYQIPDEGRGVPRAADLLARCVTGVLAGSDLDPAEQKVAVLVGTGLRELRSVELAATGQAQWNAEDLHFGSTLARISPLLDPALTIANACSAGGYALAFGQDLLECGGADRVVVAAADTVTESMHAMIARVAERPYRQVRPFDADRGGVLLGEAAVALVLAPAAAAARPGQVRVLATGLSCDAGHETAPDLDGICRAMRQAHRAAGRRPREVDVVVSHGTGTALNDPVEAAAIERVLLADGGRPVVTGVKGSLGHTSGAAALINVVVAADCLATGVVPPVTGLRRPDPAAAKLRFATAPAPGQAGQPPGQPPSLVQSHAFGFGGVNAVTLLERV